MEGGVGRARWAGVVGAALGLALQSVAEPMPGVTSVVLRGAAVVSDAGPVLLGEVARIEGPLADRMASLELSASFEALTASEGEWRVVRFADAEKLLGASLGEDVATVTLRGRDALVRLDLSAAPDDASPTADESAPTPVASGTIGGLIALQLAARLSRQSDTVAMGPSDVRLRFEPDDLELVNRPVGTDLVFVTPVGLSARGTVRIEVVRDSVVAEEHELRVVMRVRREVLVATGVVERDTPAEAIAWERREEWLTPDVNAVTAEDLKGARSIRRILPGEVVLAGMIERPVAVKRGAVIKIEVVRGGLRLEDSVRARGEGQVGDLIEVETMSKPTQRFRARITGAGRAVREAPVPREPRVP